ncbi:MAG: imidazole glycerol phosphate synthase subunit HisH [Acidimicrobiales bacterium]|nr:imidazole glycerol phosphate synthase subunit HisH [Acidimicrobiales bacterium]
MTAAGQATRIAVLDYGIGNLRSAQKALEHVGADAVLTAEPGEILGAAGVVLPGVGAFGRCMDALEASGLDLVVADVLEAGTPFLGICVGMQLLYEGSDETPGRPGLGVLPGHVRRLPDGVKHPQMQWNVVDRVGESPLFAGLDDPLWMYFVHSFAGEHSPQVVATCDYGGPVVAAVALDNLMATQFHPEKSGTAGLALLANFVTLAQRAPRVPLSAEHLARCRGSLRARGRAA